VPVLAGETHRAPFRKRRDAASTFCSRSFSLFLLPLFSCPLSLVACPYFQRSHHVLTNTTRNENGVGWIFDLLCLASRARRTALLSESGGTPLLLSAPALLPLSLAPCRLPLFSKEMGYGMKHQFFIVFRVWLPPLLGTASFPSTINVN